MECTGGYENDLLSPTSSLWLRAICVAECAVFHAESDNTDHAHTLPVVVVRYDILNQYIFVVSLHIVVSM